MEQKNNNRKKISKGKKVLVIVILILLALIVGTVFAINYEFNKRVHRDFKTINESGKNDEKWVDSKSINILILGLEDVRTDTIMVASYNPKRNDLNIISIPRDSYIENNYRGGAMHKINSLYGITPIKEGPERVAKEVSRILGAPINYYVLVDYDAVRNIVDAVGGVEVNIPFNMYYDDPTSKPPLHVHFQKGPTTIMGNQAVEYLRWRKNSDGSRGEEGDVGRIKRQQDFVIKAIKKSLDPSKIHSVAQAFFDNVETSFKLSEILSLAKTASSMDKNNISAYQAIGIPYVGGVEYLWYYGNDIDKNHKLMDKILDGEKIEKEDLEPSKAFIQSILNKDKSSQLWNNSNKNIKNPKINENPVGNIDIDKDAKHENEVGSVIFGEDDNESQNFENEDIPKDNDVENTDASENPEYQPSDGKIDNNIDPPADNNQSSNSEPIIDKPTDTPSETNTNTQPEEESPIF